MKDKYLFICLICSFLAFTISCSDRDEFEKGGQNNFSIKEIVGQGKTNSKFIYNSSGKINESQSLIYYERYTYDKMNRLVKKESASDPLLLSSSYQAFANKTELMSADNCEISQYEIFNYNHSGQIESIENYNKQNGSFTYGSKRTFEYEGDKIVKMNYHLNNGTINNFNVYAYDKSGNVISEKYYYNSQETGTPTLSSETTFKYDAMNNPFMIFNETGYPGLYTNPNNIIETTNISYMDVPGFENPTISKTRYEYNSNGYPVKVIDESNSFFEYIY
jgi:hypothetical protein